MLRGALCLLVVAGACGGSDDEPGPLWGAPEEWDPLACAWADRVDSGGGPDTAHRVALTSNGDVLVAGGIAGEDQSLWLRRYSATGEVVWTNDDAASVGEPSRTVEAMAVDHQDRLGLTGFIWDDYDGDFWVAQYEANGELAWSVDLDTGGHGEAACFTPTGELYVTGGALDPEDNSSLYATRIWLGKLAADGTLLWERTESGLQPGQTGGHALVCDESGGVVVLGSMILADGYSESWIRRYDPQGEALWTTEVADPHGTAPQAMLPGPTAAAELLVTVRIFDHTQLFRLDLADGAIRSDRLAPDQLMLGTDEGGIFVDGNFDVDADTGCEDDLGDPCAVVPYWGYAYYDWDAELRWWRADTSGIPNDEAENAMHSLVAGDGGRVLVGAVQDDIWVCHE
jgi:hypothetical protein